MIDSGDGVTHVIPVYEGYTIGSAIKSVPIAGRDITKFVMELMREREKTIPSEDAMEGALPLYSDRIITSMTASPCILYQRLQVRLDEHFYAVHVVADMLRSV